MKSDEQDAFILYQYIRLWLQHKLPTTLTPVIMRETRSNENDSLLFRGQVHVIFNGRCKETYLLLAWACLMRVYEATLRRRWVLDAEKNHL